MYGSIEWFLKLLGYDTVHVASLSVFTQVQIATFTIDLMHHDVVEVTLKTKMVASSTSSGENSKMIVFFDLYEGSNKSLEPLLGGPATSEMSALLPFKFLASGKYDATLDTGFVRDYNYHNARSRRESIVLRHYA